MVCQFGDLPSHLDSGRAGSDDHERHPRRSQLGIVLDLGHLEGAKDATAQLERVVDALEAGRVHSPLVVAEVRRFRARCDDQAVVASDHLVVQGPRGHRASVQIDIGHVPEHDAGVALVAQHLARGRSDLPIGEDARRDLIQQWLEEVVGGPVDQGHRDRGPFQAPGREQASEARADDHHAMRLRCSHVSENQ